MIKIDKEKCIACKECLKDCVAGNIEIVNEKADIKKDTCLLCGHCIAICPQYAIAMDNYSMDEVKEIEREYLIKPDQLLDFIKFRRSVRQFTKEPVSDDLLLNMIEAGRYTATGSNRQDVSYIIVREQLPELRRLALEQLAEDSAQQLKQNPAMAGFAMRWASMLESDIECPGKNDWLFYNAPCLILLVSDSVVDASLASSNMELMAVAQGLGMFYCGFFMRAAQGNERIKKLLGLNETQEVRMCLVIGHPDVTYRRTVPRKPASVIWK